MASAFASRRPQPTVPQIAAVRPPKEGELAPTRAGVGIKRHDDEEDLNNGYAEKGAEATQDLANSLNGFLIIERLINGIDKQVMTKRKIKALVTDMVNDGEVHKDLKAVDRDGDVDNEDSLLRQTQQLRVKSEFFLR
ncbi:hypothetical protein SPFM15_00054 [Salmonella phage SPFM15]|nr:hypothetical protein SPFM5_00049 [Salmonella phage SPFM5]VFR13678.1 hypothetical protein SPFM15_00054 [Salmonella phage SPFM15]